MQMRNKTVIYSPKTDLRGKKVELRDGRIVRIDKSTSRNLCTITHMWVWYDYNGENLCQVCSRKGYNHPWETDIMKVIK